MTNLRDYRSYPSAYLTLIERAAFETVEISCASFAAARSLEARLHQFFGILHRSALKMPEVHAVDALSRKVQIKAREDGVVVCRPRDMVPDQGLILAALGLANAGSLDAPKGEGEGVPMSRAMREMFGETLTTGEKPV